MKANSHISTEEGSGMADDPPTLKSEDPHDDGSDDEKNEKNLEDFAPPIAFSSRKRTKAQQLKRERATGNRASLFSSSVSDTQLSIIEAIKNKEKIQILRRFAGKIAKSAATARRQAHEYDDFEFAKEHKWTLRKVEFKGHYEADKFGKEEDVNESLIRQGIKEFKANPKKYLAIMYQTDALDWPRTKQKYTLIHRKGTERFRFKYPTPDGWMSLLVNEYNHLPEFENNILPEQYRDQYTDTVLSEWTYKKNIHSNGNLPLLPGRGMGIGDKPSLKIIGDVYPEDVVQGFVGNCWMLSGIASLAEFDGAIRRLFRKTPNLDQMPTPEPNLYTVTLWDLETWTEKDIVVDERLCAHPDKSGRLLGAKPSDDGELWVCYLEKAMAAHCGGWNRVTGGKCTHAWAMLTGCKHQYTIKKNDETGKFACFGKYDTFHKKWAKQCNSPHATDGRVWRVPWPKVGGGGNENLELTADELFLRLCAWDDKNYIIAAGIESTEEEGLVDTHAYSVIDCLNDVAGTPIDLLKVRNPWGKGEIEDGLFNDDGYGWDMWPEVREEIDPIVADDGVFYVTKEEFFENFGTIFVSASNMTHFLKGKGLLEYERRSSSKSSKSSAENNDSSSSSTSPGVLRRDSSKGRTHQSRRRSSIVSFSDVGLVEGTAANHSRGVCKPQGPEEKELSGNQTKSKEKKRKKKAIETKRKDSWTKIPLKN